jgi:hypothetical protein
MVLFSVEKISQWFQNEGVVYKLPLASITKRYETILVHPEQIFILLIVQITSRNKINFTKKIFKYVKIISTYFKLIFKLL